MPKIIQRPEDKTMIVFINLLKISSSEPCPVGQYKSADKTTCKVCEEGSVSSTTGATFCTKCDPGQEPNSDKTQCGQ